MIKTVFTSSDTIHALRAGPDGLWIAHQGGVTHFDPRRVVAAKWTTGDGLPALPVLAVTTDAERVVLATPNGVAWCDDAHALVRDGTGERRRMHWERGLMHPDGAGVFVHGVAFVRGHVYAAAGGGRLYRKGDHGFERVELPLAHARLTQIVSLAATHGRLRLLVLTNNSGVLLLATGSGEEPSAYQWGEEEGLQSRYTTTIGVAGEHVIVGVRGGVHVAPVDRLVDAPEDWSRWGRIRLDETPVSNEGSRVTALCEHGEDLWIGTAQGLHRLPLSQLANAAADTAAATRVDEAPVRHLASTRGELWLVHGNELGRWSDATAVVPESQPVAAGEAHGSLRARLFRPRTPRHGDGALVQPRRAHFVAETRWRPAGSEPECRRCSVLAASPDALAVGGESGRVALYQDGRWSTEVVARLRRSPEVQALAWDAEDAVLWAATRFGLHQRDARGRWHRDHLFPGRTVHALCAWSGSVAALGTAGLHVFVQGEWVDVPLGVDRPTLAVGAADDRGLAMWGRSGFYVWRAGATRPERVDADLGRATCMTWGEGEELWVGGDRGLACWDGARWTRHAWNDERRDRTTALAVHRGTLFVGSQAGLFVAPARGVRAATDAQALESAGRRFGLLDGLPDPQVAAIAVHGSRVWIGTPAGLVMFE